MLLKTSLVVFILFPLISAAQQYKQPAVVVTAYGKWTFTNYPDKIIKVTFLPTGSTRNEQVSDAVILKPLSKFPLVKKTKEMETVFFQDQSYAQLNETGIDFYTSNNKLLSLLNTFYSNEKRGFRFSLQSDEKIFGTGERSIPLNRRGYTLPLNNAPAYGYSLNAASLNFSVPFILSSKGYAIFFDNPSIGYLDIGKTDMNLLEYSVTSGELSFYIIPGKDYNAILVSYQKLCGTQPLPPRWALGNLMSRFGYRNEKQATGILNQMKKDSVPVDAIVFDLFWFGDSIKNSLGNLSWMNKEAWPNPEKMINNFTKQNIKTILITEPFILKTSVNYKASEKLLSTDSAGNPYTLQQFYFGKGGIIDIFRNDAKKWFYKKYKDQMDIGVTGWWGDLGEPENHPADVYHNLNDLGFKRKFSAGEIHNIYGHYWSKMLAENYKKDYPNKRLFHLNRSGYAGSPRYNSFPWSGDVSRSWQGLQAQLPLIQGMSISGIPYMHSDAGGFAGGDGDAELYVRWLQFAAFTPIYRPHGTAFGNLEANVKDIPSEASLWPDPAKTLAKAAAVNRYRWLPYNYNLCYRQANFGEPLIKPMFFLNNNDSNLYNAQEQYMWGNEIMVVPITEKNQRVKKYYIPAGEWTNMNNLKKTQGPLWVSDSTISIESIPVFAKEGSFIPLASPIQNTEAYNTTILNVFYIPSAQPSQYELYEDDGKDANSINNKKYEIITFKSSGIKKSTTIRISGNNGSYIGRVENRKMVLNVCNIINAPSEILINGKKLSVENVWNASVNKLEIPLNFRHTTTSITINF